MQIQPAIRPAQPQVDLLSSPLDNVNPLQLSLSQPAPVAAPPIPPNPEKEHLQLALRQTLNQQIQAKVSNNLSAIGPLSAQNAALRNAAANLALEIRQLEQFAAVLASNEEILRRSMQDCDVVIAKSQGSEAKRSSLIQQQQQASNGGNSHSRTNSRSAVTTSHMSSDAVLPNIDDLLITPNLVAGQLWRLCAEEAAAREAMYVLQRGLGRGRVSGPEFIRLMRGLARECFFKMALAKKCARGMGLDLVEGRPVH
jgi:ESCRT-I complex subunit TSG101